MIMKMMQEHHQEHTTHSPHRKQVFDTVSPDKNQIQERIYQEQQNKKERQVETPAKTPSEKVVIDTNVIIDLLAHKSRIATQKYDIATDTRPYANEYFGSRIHHLLGEGVGKIVLTETVLGESTRQLGWDNKTIMNNLKEEFGERLEIVSTPPQVVEHARMLENKYECLHSPDSIIIAIAKKMKADVITNDKCVIECCKKEKINVFDHRSVAVPKEPKKPEKRRPPKPEKKTPTNKRWSLDEIDQEFNKVSDKNTPKS